MIKKILLFFVLMILFSSSAYAFNYTVIDSKTDFLPNETDTFLRLNITEVNFTKENLTIFILQTPFKINWSFDDDNLSFNISVPNSFGIGVFSSKISFYYKNNLFEEDFDINILEYTSWFVNKSVLIDRQSLNVGDIYLSEFSIINDGNIEVDLIVFSNDTCTKFLDTQINRKIYPLVKNQFLSTFTIPIDMKNQFFNCSILVSNKENTSDNKSIDFIFNITDNILPNIDFFDIPDSMALKPSMFELIASDNVNISSAIIDITYENYSFWDINGTRYEIYKNISLGKRNFSSFEDSWSHVFVNTERIGLYYANITVFDEDNNSMTNLTSFYIDELESIFYNESIESGFLQVDMESRFKLFSNDFDIPIEIKISDIQILEDNKLDFNENKDNFFKKLYKLLPNFLRKEEPIIIEETENLTYLVGIEDFLGNKRYFKDKNGIFELEGNGDIFVLFTSNQPGRFIIKFNLTTVEQHVDLEEITLSIKIIKSAKPFESYESNPVPEISIRCEFESTGDLLTSETVCINRYKWPYLLSNDNLPLMKTIAELNKERELWEENIANLDNTIKGYQIKEIYLIFLLLVLGSFVLCDRFINPIIILLE